LEEPTSGAFTLIRRFSMLKLKVSGMTCGHCVAAVTKAVKAVPSVEDVAVSLERGEVTVTGHPDPSAVRDAIVSEGYEIQAAG
jgi:copper chaperone